MPSTIRYTGAAITRAQVTTITISSNTNGHTFAVTLNTKVVTYTAASDTTTTIAVALCALLAARTEPEFAEITFATAANAITCTGPDDGTPFTLTLGGSGTSSQATTSGTPSSPNDLSIAANYSGGALPSAADTLVFTGHAVDVKWGLTALGTTALTVVREKSYTGRIGLPDRNPAGYPEYRTTHLLLKSASTTWESAPGDAAGQFRLAFQTTAVALVVQGEPSSVEPGGEALEVKGMPASSSLKAAGGSVAVCPYAGQTGTLAGVFAADATVTLGADLTSSNVMEFQRSRADVQTTPGGALTVGEGADVTVSRAAAGPAAATNVESGGRLRWLASGQFQQSLSVFARAEFDANGAPGQAMNADGLQINLYAGSTFRDRYGKTLGNTVNFVGCAPQDCTLELYDAAALTLG